MEPTNRWSGSRISDLPTEILALVFSYSRLTDLKNIRLCWRAIQFLVEPSLFREIVVVPHRDSLKGLVNLSQHTTLRHHVKKIIYNNRWGNIPQHLLEHVRSKPHGRSLAKYLDGLAKHIIRGAEQHYEIAFLSRAFSSLPSLASLWIWEQRTYEDTLDAFPSFYQRVCDSVGVDYGGIMFRIQHHEFDDPAKAISSAFLSLLASRKSLRDIRVGSFTSMIYHNESLVDCMLSAFSSLQSLTLLFHENALLERGSAISKLASTFHTLLHLETLELDLEGDQPEVYRSNALFRHWQFRVDGQSTFARLFPSKTHFPCLRRLSVSGLLVTEDELIGFLERHTFTLSSLSLDGAILVKPEHQASTPCWIRTLKRVQTCLDLKEMHLGGYLMNGSTQDWGLNDIGQSDNIKARMERFVVQGGECPLDEATVVSLGSTCFLGDESWKAIKSASGEIGDPSRV